MQLETRIDRRRFLRRGALAAGLAWLPDSLLAAVDSLTLTPRQTAGPFFPDALPLERDNDLVALQGDNVTARGTVTNVTGRILDDRGRPITDALVEIWQCDANGRYHHMADGRGAPLDQGFQGYGRYETGDDGGYRFRTIRPVAYPGRTPHIHFKISGAGIPALTTQLYVAGEPRNARDPVLNRIRDAAQRAAVIADFVPDTLGDATLQARFDIVLAADGRFDARDV